MMKFARGMGFALFSALTLAVVGCAEDNEKDLKSAEAKGGASTAPEGATAPTNMEEYKAQMAKGQTTPGSGYAPGKGATPKKK